MLTPILATLLVFGLFVLLPFYFFKRTSFYKMKIQGIAMQFIICPNVNYGYKGEPKKIAKGSTAVGIILLCIMILPGLLYFAFMSGYKYICPQCGIRLS